MTKIAKNISYLVSETQAMENKRRCLEIEGEERFSKVHTKEHPNEIPQSTEGELQSSLLSHPLMQTQSSDGISPDLNINPLSNSDAPREFDNRQNEKKLKKLLQLGLLPTNASVPKPTIF